MNVIPPIAKVSERLQLDIEQAVRRFQRYHRYATGAKLREQIAEVRRLVDRAWRDPDMRLEWTERLQWAIDELRLTMQLGQGLRAFTSFAQFEALIRLTEDLGRQVGGWQRQQRQHLKGPEFAASCAAEACPDTEYAGRLARGQSMTTPRYHQGCSAGSQVPADAANPDYAWIVNFNNGNSNNDNRDNNNALARAVRSVAPGECQGGVTLQQLHAAWKLARSGKVPSTNQLHFDSRWADDLLRLERQLNTGTWSPGRSACFIATRPKAREIHAPDFADRVVHHWLVPQLEAIYEPGFIADSFANRKGKGTHAAVRRLQRFVRQVNSGQGRGWFLQLDVANFFNRIHRPKLWAMLKPRLQRAGLPVPAMRATHALLRKSPLAAGVLHLATPAEREQVPAHKRLENAPAGCGLPIGNLSSQFFANVYLDALDQFVKHELKAKRYLRYVDDFVLVHHDRAQLEDWCVRIERFLADRLQLSLKDDVRLRPLADGIDFLGYVVHPTHTRVRRRVVDHARAALSEFQRAHVSRRGLRATPEQLRAVQAVWGSYEGHLQHANAHRLRAQFHSRFPWLSSAMKKRRFAPALDGRTLTIAIHEASNR